ncbi:MAG: hypothetical protein AMXMBFR36_28870 [Acidobacteriota bacterium]
MSSRRPGTLAAAVSALAAFALAAAAQAPPPSSPEAREKMQALARMVGEWEGEAWSEMRPGAREVATQREIVEWAAGGEALLVRGSGSVEGRVVHEAVGLIFWDARAQGYAMWAYRAGSGATTQQLRLEGDTLIWGFTTPGGEIRFTQRIDGEGRWIETGERSADQGATWQPFLGMTLSRK